MSGGDGFAVDLRPGGAATSTCSCPPSAARAGDHAARLGLPAGPRRRPAHRLLERRRLAADGRRPAARHGALGRLPGARSGAARRRAGRAARRAAGPGRRLPRRHTGGHARLRLSVPAARRTLRAAHRDDARRPLRGHPRDAARAAYLDQLRADLPRVAAASDRLLIFYQAPAFYLFWPHRVATNSVWISSAKGLDVNDDPGPLPPATTAYYARQRHRARRRRARHQHAPASRRPSCWPLLGGSRSSSRPYYRLVLVRSQYAVFRRVGAAALRPPPARRRESRRSSPLPPAPGG